MKQRHRINRDRPARVSYNNYPRGQSLASRRLYSWIATGALPFVFSYCTFNLNKRELVYRYTEKPHKE